MIVIAIVGIIASVAIPEYVKYAKRAQYSEVVLATTKYKTSIEAAYNMGINLTDMDTGTNGLPPAITVATTHTDNLKSLTVAAGVITATAADEFENAIYQLEPTEVSNGLTWRLNDTVSTCLTLGYCTPL
jgi:type II secretory pathway pseudopilin PulG